MPLYVKRLNALLQQDHDELLEKWKADQHAANILRGQIVELSRGDYNEARMIVLEQVLMRAEQNQAILMRKIKSLAYDIGHINDLNF